MAKSRTPTNPGLPNLRASRSVIDSVKKWHAALFVAAGFVCALVAVPHLAPWGAKPAVPPPLVLQRVQALGDLHTARHTYQHVFQQETSRPVADWAAYIPGAASLVKSTTSNTALVTMKAEVEAGVDLSKAHMEGRILVLPRAQIYTPSLEGKMHDHKAGLLWRDDNIAFTAEDEARANAVRAAKRGGILKLASDEAASRVAVLLKSLGSDVAVRTEN